MEETQPHPLQPGDKGSRLTPFDDFVSAVETKTGRQGRKVGKETRLLCPAHNDHDPSLDVREGADGRPLVQCRSHGCSYETICSAIGREPNDFLPTSGKQELDKAYRYVDETGHLLFEVIRRAPKDFRQRRHAPRDPDADSDGWVWKLGDTRRVLYRLPDVLEAVARGRTVYVVEGEKDVEAVRQAGGVGTCNQGGAGKWHAAYSKALAGADVVVVADRDSAGQTRRCCSDQPAE
jgi:hypothetical protein